MRSLHDDDVLIPARFGAKGTDLEDSLCVRIYMRIVGHFTTLNAAAFLFPNLLNPLDRKERLMRRDETVQSACGLLPAEDLDIGANQAFERGNCAS